MRLLLAGDQDAWLILLAMTAISLFPLGLLRYAIRLMKLADRDAGQAEESIAVFQTLQSHKQDPQLRP